MLLTICIKIPRSTIKFEVRVCWSKCPNALSQLSPDRHDITNWTFHVSVVFFTLSETQQIESLFIM